MSFHHPYVSSSPFIPWDMPATDAPADRPFSRYQAAHMVDPQLTRRPTSGSGRAAPRTPLPHWTGTDHAHTHDPYAAAPACGHAAAGGWAAPHHSPYGSGNQAAVRMNYHTTQMREHDKQRLYFALQARRAEAYGSGDAAYFHAACVYHTQQSQAHKQAAWHEMSQLWQPSLAGQAAPGSMFNAGGWAEAATLPSVRHALNSAVDSIQRRFRF